MKIKNKSYELINKHIDLTTTKIMKNKLIKILTFFPQQYYEYRNLDRL